MSCEECENYKKKKPENPTAGEEVAKEVMRLLNSPCPAAACNDCVFNNYGPKRDGTKYLCGRIGIKQRIHEVLNNEGKRGRR